MNYKFLLMMFICIVSWACAFPFIRLVLEEVSWITLTILRFIVVCITSLIVITVGYKKFTPLKKSDIIPIFLLGFFGVIGYHLSLNYGEEYVSSSVASLIVATIPVFSTIFALVLLKERITLWRLIGLTLGLTGVSIISLLGISNVSLEIRYISGVFAVLASAILGSLYTIFGKRLLSRYSGLSLTLYAILLGSIVLIPLSIFYAPLTDEVMNISLISWLAILFLGLISTTLAYVLWYIALEKKTASEISIYLYGVPLLSTFISYILFKEGLTLYFILGAGLIITGLVCINKKNNNN
ncbi:MAG: DMT family transporter [Candidatus Thermoplasmatota archaeon]